MVITRNQRRLVDDGDDRAGDEVPVVADLERYDRLNVQHVEGLFVGAPLEVGVVLKRHADEAGDRILHGTC